MVSDCRSPLATQEMPPLRRVASEGQSLIPQETCCACLSGQVFAATKQGLTLFFFFNFWNKKINIHTEKYKKKNPQ